MKILTLILICAWVFFEFFYTSGTDIPSSPEARKSEIDHIEKKISSDSNEEILISAERRNRTQKEMQAVWDEAKVIQLNSIYKKSIGEMSDDEYRLFRLKSIDNIVEFNAKIDRNNVNKIKDADDIPKEIFQGQGFFETRVLIFGIDIDRIICTTRLTDEVSVAMFGEFYDQVHNEESDLRFEIKGKISGIEKNFFNKTINISHCRFRKL